MRRIGRLPRHWERLARFRRPAAAGAALVYVPHRPNLDFDRGVEFGLLFARVCDFGGVEACVHADMAEMVMRLAESRGLPFRASPHEHGPECGECPGRADCKDGGEWLDVTIGSAVSR